ncbi:hypothetical protein O7608_09355 [Solwaraspora sp. WMMA2056]|uniref:hypothetical protein n=1 Tax=Solwaraspora sp. WMMA2056 TaxID=3015161 RepID=UPI00259BD2C4|nr:hypothetical protein [Solwaraspora sp. WMMA2056]WJK44232.1 hypothetical protein O7608_09355 [Solwaraspora sp. WMMA2056]
MIDANTLAQTMFSGLSPLVIEDVVDEGERIVVRARTPHGTAVCLMCGVQSTTHTPAVRGLAFSGQWFGRFFHAAI